jgi:hypothetical protein
MLKLCASRFNKKLLAFYILYAVLWLATNPDGELPINQKIEG